MTIIFQPSDSAKFKKIIHTLCKSQSPIYWTFTTDKIILLSIFEKENKKAIIRASIPLSEMDKYERPNKTTSFCINCSLLRNMSNIFSTKDKIEFTYSEYLKLKVMKEKILRIGLQIEKCHTPRITPFTPQAGFKLESSFFVDIITQLKCSGENTIEIKGKDILLGCQIDDKKIKTLSLQPDEITGTNTKTSIPSSTLRFLPGKTDLISDNVKIYVKDNFPVMIEYLDGIKLIIILSN